MTTNGLVTRARRASISSAFAIVGLVAGGACRQPNPDWLEPGGDEGGSTGNAEASGTGGEPPPSCSEPGALGSGECPAECTACIDGVCRIDCLAGACRAGLTACPQGWSCTVVCDGRNSCRDATIACPADGDCLVDCAGRDACRALTVTCGGAACSLLCAADSNTCEGTTLLCGEGNGLVSCEDPVSVLALIPGADGCACEAQGCG